LFPKKNNKTKQFIVIGMGRFGTSVAKTLNALGHDVLAVDRVEVRIDEIADHVTHAVQVDALDESSLQALGVRNFDVAIVAIGEDIQSNILVSVMLKDLGVKYVVSKARNAMHGKVLERIGIDRVIYPERDMGVRVAHSLITANVLDLIELSTEYSIAEIKAPTDFLNKSLGELHIRANYKVSVIAIKKNELIIAAPGAEDIIHIDDILVVVGKNEDISELPSR
jgi:trk system potassium uptake protein